MASERKKAYMRKYNQRPEVKVRKAAYMRRIRAEKELEAARNLVRVLLDCGYEGMAFEYAKERAPEMLLTVKSRPK